MSHASGNETDFRTLGARLDQTMLADRAPLRRDLATMQSLARSGKPFDRLLSRWQQRFDDSSRRRSARAAAIPQPTFDLDLPVVARKDEIAAAIAKHPVVVVCGETGSGKSTQLPKICLELGRGVAGMIGHTQPRRIAARSVAARIAEELKTPPGSVVGSKIRFADQTSETTAIKLMTDGILLAEIVSDRFLDAYDCLIIDEAHERSLNIDFLLGYLRGLIEKRRDLKIIVTSATIDAERFAAYFAEVAGHVPIVWVEGRTYPVELRYRPLVDEDDDATLHDALEGALRELIADHPGDVLAFLPTERAIRDAAKALRGRFHNQSTPAGPLEILPLYGRLSQAEQQRIFAGHRGMRVTLATNVAESSLTVPGVRSVIDEGTARVSRYSAHTKVQRLPIEPISKASADQRAGRCGRVGPGVCIRLYDESDYETREAYSLPEIQRTNLASVALRLMSLGLGDAETFPFLDPPKPAAVRDGYATLFELGAVTERRELTPIGRQLARLPVDPRIGRMILGGHNEGCLAEVLIIASALEIQDPRDRPVDKQQAADEAHKAFRNEKSDFLSYLQLWEFFQGLKETHSRSQIRRECEKRFLSYVRMREWVELHSQLRDLCRDSSLAVKSKRDDLHAIHRALLTGLLSNVAMKGDGHEYIGAGGQKFHLWPGSALFAAKPKWVMAGELVETSRRFLRTAAEILPEWIEPLAGHLVERSYSEPRYAPRQGCVMASERITLFGLPIVPKRGVRYGKIDPVVSRQVFVQQALVEGQITIEAPFLAHNRTLRHEIETMQNKLRRGDLYLGEGAIYDFYDSRVGEGAYDLRRFDEWRRIAEKKDPQLLFMSLEDLVTQRPERDVQQEFPNSLKIQRAELPLDYRFAPGDADDGVTVVVPEEGVNQLDRERLGWLVPGLLEEKVTELLRGLPRNLRRNFVPAPETAKRALPFLKFGEGSLEEQLAKALRKISGETVNPEDFAGAELPQHLRMNVRVVDAEGATVASSRDLVEVRGKTAAVSDWTGSFDDPRFNRDDVTKWDFGELPESIPVKRGDTALLGYPSLVEEGEKVALRVLDDPIRAEREMRAGVRRLFMQIVRRDLRNQIEWLPEADRMKMVAGILPGRPDFERQVATLLAERALFGDERDEFALNAAKTELPRTQEDFEALVEVARKKIPRAVAEVAKILPAMLLAYQEVRLKLDEMKRPEQAYAVSDVRDQLASLAAPGFLANTPWRWLAQYPRFFKAALKRLEKLASAADRDAQSRALISPWVARLAERRQRHEELRLLDPELDLFRWMLEEYRVSLFAQELGTSLPVSDKRLEKQWEKVRAV